MEWFFTQTLVSLEAVKQKNNNRCTVNRQEGPIAEY